MSKTELSFFVLCLSLRVLAPVNAVVTSFGRLVSCSPGNSRDDVTCPQSGYLVAITASAPLQTEGNEIILGDLVDDQGRSRVLVNPLKILLSRSPLVVRYPLAYVKSVNYRPVEQIIDTDSCIDDPNALDPTCGWVFGTSPGGLHAEGASNPGPATATRVPGSQGFCCLDPEASPEANAGLGAGAIAGNAGSNANASNNTAGVASGRGRAHCLRMHPVWYQGYVPGVPLVATDVRLDVERAYALGGGSHVATASIPIPSLGDTLNGERTLRAHLVLTSVAPNLTASDGPDSSNLPPLVSVMAPSMAEHVLLVPDVSDDSELPLAGALGEMGLSPSLFLIQPSAGMADGSACGRIGAGFAAFRASKQAVCQNKQQQAADACIPADAQIEALLLQDMERVRAGSQPRHSLRASQWAVSTGDITDAGAALSPSSNDIDGYRPSTLRASTLTTRLQVGPAPSTPEDQTGTSTDATSALSTDATSALLTDAPASPPSVPAAFLALSLVLSVDGLDFVSLGDVPGSTPGRIDSVDATVAPGGPALQGRALGGAQVLVRNLGEDQAAFSLSVANCSRAASLVGTVGDGDLSSATAGVVEGGLMGGKSGPPVMPLPLVVPGGSALCYGIMLAISLEGVGSGGQAPNASCVITLQDGQGDVLDTKVVTFPLGGAETEDGTPGPQHGGMDGGIIVGNSNGTNGFQACALRDIRCAIRNKCIGCLVVLAVILLASVLGALLLCRIVREWRRRRHTGGFLRWLLCCCGCCCALRKGKEREHEPTLHGGAGGESTTKPAARGRSKPSKAHVPPDAAGQGASKKAGGSVLRSVYIANGALVMDEAKGTSPSCGETYSPNGMYPAFSPQGMYPIFSATFDGFHHGCMCTPRDEDGRATAACRCYLDNHYCGGMGPSGSEDWPVTPMLPKVTALQANRERQAGLRVLPDAVVLYVSGMGPLDGSHHTPSQRDDEVDSITPKFW